MMNTDIDNNDEQIKALELRILDALVGRQMPVRLKNNESIIDPIKFSKSIARDYYIQCRWVQKKAKDHLRTLGIEVDHE